tara:strand:- start:859 stop:1662 length:804 start_codon:yes stop_codon:yes gene_type:complete
MTKYKKKSKGKVILIMGLPGSGKTTLAKCIYKDLNAQWLNADKVRKKYNDWDFSPSGRIRQSKRLNKLSKVAIIKGKNVVVDFVCPTPQSFKHFKSDFIVWMDTIKKSRFSYFNKIFKKPKRFNLRITSLDSDLWKIVIKDKIYKIRWNDKNPTAQMLGRYQPWHEGHRKLFETIIKKNLQVNIQVKNTGGTDKNNPFHFNKIKKKILKDLIDFKSRIKVTIAPNITNIFTGRKVGYKIDKILTPKKYRDISASNIRKILRKSGKLK